MWATHETRVKKVAKAVMVPLIISNDGDVHKDIIRRWKDFAPTSRSNGSGWPRASFATMWSSLGSSSRMAAGSLRLGEKSARKKPQTILDPQIELQRQKDDWND